MGGHRSSRAFCARSHPAARLSTTRWRPPPPQALLLSTALWPQEGSGRATPDRADPKAVARWETRSGDRSGDEYVELISYRETRKYVKAVLENYRIYRQLYGSNAPPPRLY